MSGLILVPVHGIAAMALIHPAGRPAERRAVHRTEAGHRAAVGKSTIKEEATTMIEKNKFYSLEEVAELLGVTYQLIYKLVRTGEMPALRVGKMYRVTGDDLEAYLEKSRVKTAAEEGKPIPVVCSVCGRSYVSSLSITGTCEVCGLPICRSCTEIDHAKRCEVHALDLQKENGKD